LSLSLFTYKSSLPWAGHGFLLHSLYFLCNFSHLTSQHATIVHLSYKELWSEIWRNRRFRVELIVTILLTIVALATLANFLNWVETRPGVTYNDPVLNFLPIINLTWLTFSLIYIGLISGIVFLTRRPRTMLIAFQSYVLLVAVRIAAMYVLPLAAPPTAIPLQDPTVEYLGTGKLLTQDLFFSGHTSTLFLLFLTAQGKTLRTVFLVCTVAVGISVLLQHVHWTVDVLVAPFIAYTCYRVVTLLAHKRWAQEISRMASGLRHAAKEA
jgi:membrane-associated phospholipid phosphatase